MQAIWNGKVIAEAPKEELIYIEGNWYFPPQSVNQTYLRKSPTPYTCPWKGVCQYFDVGEGDAFGSDNAWSYPEPLKMGIERVGKNFADYVAFWRDVEVKE